MARYVLTVCVFCLALFPACTSEPDPAVTICPTTNVPEDCAGDQTEFSVGQPLSAHLVASKPFPTRQVIGKILRLSGTDTIPLGSQMISLEPDQQSVVQSLPFHEFGQQAAGTFLIEFVNENNQVIAKKEIRISPR